MSGNAENHLMATFVNEESLYSRPHFTKTSEMTILKFVIDILFNGVLLKK